MCPTHWSGPSSVPLMHQCILRTQTSYAVHSSGLLCSTGCAYAVSKRLATDVSTGLFGRAVPTSGARPRGYGIGII